MDPVWAALAEFWWIGPSVIGAGALGWAGLRGQRGAKARRLAYTASLDALRAARQDAATARVAARVARAELARAQADRAAGHASSSDVASARRELDRAQRETKAAAATLRARRATVSAERVALGRRITDPSDLPLARLMAEDDAVSARFMEYETDPARILAFPAMSDARVPMTAAFLAELRTTRALRPASADARITPAQFSAYRDGVTRLARAFQAAEAEAWRLARAEGSVPPSGPGPDRDATPAAWVVSAQEIAQNLTQTVLARGAEALARATAARGGSDSPRTSESRPAPGPDRTPGSPRTPRTPTADASPPRPREGTGDGTGGSAPGRGETTPPPTWPIPSRRTRPPGD